MDLKIIRLSILELYKNKLPCQDRWPSVCRPRDLDLTCISFQYLIISVDSISTKCDNHMSLSVYELWRIFPELGEARWTWPSNFWPENDNRLHLPCETYAPNSNCLRLAFLELVLFQLLISLNQIRDINNSNCSYQQFSVAITGIVDITNIFELAISTVRHNY